MLHYESSPCVEKITIYLEAHKKSPLRLFFREDDNKLRKEGGEANKWCLYGFGEGVIWLWQENPSPTNQVVVINFNRPLVIADLINYFLINGWNPTSNSRPLEIQDALKYLEILELTND